MWMPRRQITPKMDRPDRTADRTDDGAPGQRLQTGLRAGTRAILKEELDRFAAGLYGGQTFRALHALDEAGPGADRLPTLALVLRADDHVGA